MYNELLNMFGNGAAPRPAQSRLGVRVRVAYARAAAKPD